MRKRFEAALSFPEYLETVEKNEELWRGVYERAQVTQADSEAAQELPGKWHLLALSEDWCGDAVNILPVVARLAESTPNIELRVASRDENPDLMDAHLTNGSSRSIPVIMILDDAFVERAWWGPRPRVIQEWVMTEGMKMEPGPRYRETRRLYARDKGRATLEELLERVRSVAR